MILYLLSGAPMTATGGGALLTATGPAYVTKSAGYAPELSGGPVVVNTEYADALQRPPGAAYGEKLIVKVGGSELPEECLVDAPTVTRRDGDCYGQCNFTVNGAKFGYLDQALCDSGETVEVIHRIRGAVTGTTYDKRVFRGTVDATPFNLSGLSDVQTINCTDAAVEYDREPLTINLDLSDAAYNCVVAGVSGECEVTSVPSATTVNIAAGDVLIDRTQTGTFKNYQDKGGNGGWGYGYKGYWPPYGYGGGSNGTPGIVRVSIAATTLDLSAIPDITLTGNDAMGTKSIFIRNDGTPWACDGGSPPDAVPLANFELEFEGQIISDALLKDQRKLNLPAEQRTRAGVIIYVFGTHLGKDVSAWRFPGINNDIVGSPINETDASAIDWLRTWCIPSLWSFHVDPETGGLVFTVNKIARSPEPVKYTFHAGNMINLGIEPANRRNAASTYTVRGQSIVNNGLTQRTETSTTETFAEVPEDDGAGTRGGEIVIYGQQESKLRLVQRVKETNVYIGSSPISSHREVWRRKNPLDYKSGRIFAADQATEAFMGHLYSSPKLMLDEEDDTTHVYFGRIHQGSTHETKRYINPPSHNSVAAIDYSTDLKMGFLYDEERLTLTAVSQEKTKNGGAGFITERARVDYVFYNPHQNPETGANYARGAAGGVKWGYVFESPQLVKVSEIVTTYKRFDSETVKEETWSKAWSKDPSGNANSMCAMKGAAVLGNTQAHPIGKEHQERLYKGTLPPVQALADDVERAPIGYELSSATHAVKFGTFNKPNDLVKYVESLDMAKRVAQLRYATGICDEFRVGCAGHPLLYPHDTVAIDITSRGGRRYNMRAIVTNVDWQPPRSTDDGFEPSITTFTADVDYTDMKVVKDTRT